MSALNYFLMGVITTQYLVASLFFFRYSKKTCDNFFKYFSAAFALLGAERIVSIAIAIENELRPLVYLFRLAAFLLIIAGVLMKNRQSYKDS
jgi:hypothetical protein